MSDTRPKKLLILNGPDLPAEELAALLRCHFDVLSVSPGDAHEAIRRPDVKAVLALTSDFAPLERDLVGRQSALLLNAIGEGVCLCRPGEIVWANERFRAIDAATNGAVSAACREGAQSLASARPGATTAPSRRSDVASPAGDRLFEVVLSPVAGDGPLAPGSASPPSLAPNGAASSHLFAVVVWDVTAARRTQQKIEAIDRAGRELMRLEADAIRKMNAAERLGFLQDKITQYARELLHFDHFTIRLLDRETGELNLVMAIGLPSTWSAPTLRAGAEGNGIVGFVAATGQTYICSDASHDPRYLQGITGGASSLTTPLLLHDRVIGVFNVESSSVNAFTDDDRRFAEIFARYIAMALHILDLLVVERFTTNEAVSGRVEGEVNEPLDDLAVEAEWLRNQAATDPEAARHCDRILRDVDSIRRRIKDVARGPRTILGAEKALREHGTDPAMEGKRILIADDEEAIRNTIRDVLVGRGCVVVMHKDGAGAIECLEEATALRASSAGAACGRPFDVIISDIKMPDRNGYEVFSAAKRLDPALPVILMTGFGYDPHHSIVRASQEGLQCVLFKPFQVERLLEEVRKAVIAAPTPAPV